MHIPINAPKCPFATFQQDGHMVFLNPKGRVNYEPNSWGGKAGGPRESPEQGFGSYPAEEEGAKVRVRSETFADHYSQARQFYKSQTKVEQNHLAKALVFELSKCETPAIRSRMVSHLLNIDEPLAKEVAGGLGLKEMPKPADAARPSKDLKPSPALSIQINGPKSFKGRKVGALLTDGVDIKLFQSLKNALNEEDALLEIVAPKVGGVQASDGSWIEAKQKIDGGPSVLYDAVVLMVSKQGAKLLTAEPAARDFVADAFAHMKFIGHTPAALALFEKAGLPENRDHGFITLNGESDCFAFVTACRKVRYWDRRTG